MNVGILGCGYVANMYRLSLAEHDELNLIGVFDRERCRSENMARITGAKSYACLDELLTDPAVECILNLTNPLEHFVTSLQCLEAGKHVYTEKPLAKILEIAKEAACKGPQIGDFCRLISDTGSAIVNKRDSYLSGEFALHVTELTLACQNAGQLAAQGLMPYKMTTHLDQIEPLL